VDGKKIHQSLISTDVAGNYMVMNARIGALHAQKKGLA
jgi:hypothetical protein